MTHPDAQVHAVVGDDGLEIDTGHAFRVVARGEVDARSGPRLEAALREVIDRGASLVVLDASDITFVDSSGLRAIVRTGNDLSDKGGQLLVEGMRPAVQRLFEITGLLERFRAEAS